LLGRYDEAASAFEEVIERVPAGRLLADSNAWLALVDAARGREEQARAAMAAALEAFPSLSATQYRRRIRMKDPSALEQRIAVLQGLGLPE
jgi:TolA-binding protein